MALTNKQEKFARLIALDGLSQHDAYRLAYNVGPDTDPATINDNGYTLAKHTDIAPRIKELKASLQAEVVTDAAKILKELDKAGSGVATGPLRWADKVAALDKMAKLLGLYRDVEDERPRAVITHVTVVLDHGASHQPVVIEGEVVSENDETAPSPTGPDEALS